MILENLKLARDILKRAILKSEEIHVNKKMMVILSVEDAGAIYDLLEISIKEGRERFQEMPWDY